MISRLAGALRGHCSGAAQLLLQHLEPWQALQLRGLSVQSADEAAAGSTGAAAGGSTSGSSGGHSSGTGVSGGALGASTSGRASPAEAAAAAAPGAQLPRLAREALPRLRPPAPTPRPLPLLAALESVKAGARAKFDETVEVHVRLKVDPRRGDQMVRGAAVLPHSAGKAVRVAVFAEGDAADAARAAGADVVGGDDLVEALLESKGKAIDFNRAVAHPDMMRSLVRLGKILGPKGLMPNPKVGTLTPDVAAAVREMRRGRVEFKMDRTAIVHAPIGKVSMDPAQLYANAGALTAALLRAKPEVIKGGLPKYVSKVSVCSTMGRGVEVEASSLVAAMDAAAAAMAAAGA